MSTPQYSDSLAPFEEAFYSVDAHEETLENALDRAKHTFTNCSVAGIVWTTTGTKRLPRSQTKFDTVAELIGLIEPGITYELRIWETIERDKSEESEEERCDDNVISLARELRWTNGLGTSEIVVSTGGRSHESPLPCLVHTVRYQTHPAEGAPPGNSRSIAALEIFTGEDGNGNLVYADQLMIGAWE
jgi:hypothetical protein